MLTGDPGAGKSTIVCDIAARLSNGVLLPGEEDEEDIKPRGKLKTLILNAEDDPEDTIIWRLENQGADLEQVFVEAAGEEINNAYIKELFNFIRANNITLLVVDPIQAWIGGDADMHRANHTRAWTNQFKTLPCTTLFCRHMRKSSTDDKGPAMYGGLGSIDLTGAVRSEIRASVAKNTGIRTLERIKGNVGPSKKIHYGIHDMGVKRNRHGQVRWGLDKTVSQTAQSPEIDRKTMTDAQRTLHSAITVNPEVSRRELMALYVGAKAEGKFSEDTLDRALKEIAVHRYDGPLRKYTLKTKIE